MYHCSWQPLCCSRPSFGRVPAATVTATILGVGQVTVNLHWCWCFTAPSFLSLRSSSIRQVEVVLRRSQPIPYLIAVAVHARRRGLMALSTFHIGSTAAIKVVGGGIGCRRRQEQRGRKARGLETS